MKKLSFSIGFLVFSFSLFFQISAFAQTNRINGMVFGNNNRPVPDLWILLLNDLGTIISRVKTDNSGRFVFTGMSFGRFNIRVLTAGTDFQEQIQEAELINVGIGGGRTRVDNVQIDFYLRQNKSGNEVRINKVVFAQEIPKEAETLYQNALSSIDAKKNEESIAELKRAITVFPTYFLALEQLGVELIKTKNYQEAKECFTRSVAVNPNSFQSWYGLAFANSAVGKVEEALSSSRKAVEILPNSVEGLIIFGISLRSNMQYKEAATALLKAKSIDKNKNANVNWNLALLYYHNLKLYKETAEELENYLKLVTELPKNEVETIRKLISKCRELENKK
jgi:hypothetical protein